MEAGKAENTLLTLTFGPPAFAALLLVPLLLAGCGAHQEGRALAPTTAPSPTEGALLLQKGRAAMASGDTVRAEQYLNLAVARGADEGVALRDLLAACIGGSRLRGALDHALPYLLKHPDDDELRYLVASIHLSLGQVDAAGEQLDLLLGRSPKHADAHYLRAIMTSKLAPEQAREHFRAYLELQPSGRHASEVRGRLAELQLRGDRAGAATSNALFDQRGPSHAEADDETGAGARRWLDVRYPRTVGEAPQGSRP